jgi:predicted nucleic acid-binding protein
VTEFVLDSSVALGWFFEDESGDRGPVLLQELRKRRAHVPSLWELEMVNALLMGLRRGRTTTTKVHDFLGFLDKLALRIHHPEPGQVRGTVYQIAREFELSGYDAAYLDLARRLGLPLATLDADLEAAARRAGVPLHAG